MIGGALAAASFGVPPIALSQERLTLDLALRETLKQNPNALLQQQAVRSSRGNVLQAQGQFDPAINGTMTRNREMRPLRQDEKNSIASGTSSIVVDPSAVLSGQTTPNSPPNAQISAGRPGSSCQIASHWTT